MAWEARSGWKLVVVIPKRRVVVQATWPGSPFGMETDKTLYALLKNYEANWPGELVRDGNSQTDLLMSLYL